MYKKRDKQMEEMVAMYYTAELLRATEELHKSGLIHGCLKPAHVLLLSEAADSVDHWKVCVC